MTDRRVTPTEDLIMEVLAARYRLGEKVWPFQNAHKRAARSLEDKGLIWTTSGQTSGYFRAGLTDEGIDDALCDGYVSPLARSVMKPLAKKLRELADSMEVS